MEAHKDLGDKITNVQKKEYDYDVTRNNDIEIKQSIILRRLNQEKVLVNMTRSRSVEIKESRHKYTKFYVKNV